MSRFGFELACLLVGALVLAATVWTVGVQGLLRDLNALGWGLGVVLAVEALNVACNTAGWALAFPAGERGVSARRLLAARLAGDGVNYLTPSATVGGEVLRVRLLPRHLPAGLRWATVGLAKIGQTLAQAVFAAAGLAVLLPALLPVPGWLVWIAVATLAGGAAVVLSELAARGCWATFQRLAGRLALARHVPGAWAQSGREADRALARLGRGRSVASLGCFVAGWAVGALEIWVILTWLGVAVDWRLALALEAGSVVVDGVLFFVPAKLGTQEGGKVVLATWLGLGSSRGLTVGVVRRIRELVYAGLGLLALALLTVRQAARPAALEPAGEETRS